MKIFITFILFYFVIVKATNPTIGYYYNTQPCPNTNLLSTIYYGASTSISFTCSAAGFSTFSNCSVDPRTGLYLTKFCDPINSPQYYLNYTAGFVYGITYQNAICPTINSGASISSFLAQLEGVCDTTSAMSSISASCINNVGNITLYGGIGCIGTINQVSTGCINIPTNNVYIVECTSSNPIVTTGSIKSSSNNIIFSIYLIFICIFLLFLLL
jgi:hypothetical protein